MLVFIIFGIYLIMALAVIFAPTTSTKAEIEKVKELLKMSDFERDTEYFLEQFKRQEIKELKFYRRPTEICILVDGMCYFYDREGKRC